MRGGENRGRGEKEGEREDNVHIQCTYSSYCCISIKKTEGTLYMYHSVAIPVNTLILNYIQPWNAQEQ